MGLYETSSNENDITLMFDRAHFALTEIKDNYKQHVAFYDKNMREKVLLNQEMSAALPRAIANNDLRPYLQPIADSKGNIIGAEALARWFHPEKGFLSPAAFIPLFENNGMIADVDRHIWRSACKILSDWKDTHPELFISVNISPKDFYFINVFDEIDMIVKEYGIEPAKLRIEITESVMMTNIDEKLDVLKKFHEAGYIVELDDFGSGYSSFNLLKDMPVDLLKIDMSFIRNSSDNLKAKTIVKNIIQLSADLGITSLTEGVETEAQFKALVDMGCILFQGYYFSKPVSIDEFEEFL
jgi:EAL domain-containing protein (putative c-di-GMP-specific phosphodiesterase class I)